MKKLFVILMFVMFGVGANSATPNNPKSTEESVINLTINDSATKNLISSANGFIDYVKDFKSEYCKDFPQQENKNEKSQLEQLCDGISTKATQAITKLSDVNKDAKSQKETFEKIKAFYDELKTFQNDSLQIIDIANASREAQKAARELTARQKQLDEALQKLHQAMVDQNASLTALDYKPVDIKQEVNKFDTDDANKGLKDYVIKALGIDRNDKNLNTAYNAEYTNDGYKNAYKSQEALNAALENIEKRTNLINQYKEKLDEQNKAKEAERQEKIKKLKDNFEAMRLRKSALSEKIKNSKFITEEEKITSDIKGNDETENKKLNDAAKKILDNSTSEKWVANQDEAKFKEPFNLEDKSLTIEQLEKLITDVDKEKARINSVIAKIEKNEEEEKNKIKMFDDLLKCNGKITAIGKEMMLQEGETYRYINLPRKGDKHTSETDIEKNYYNYLNMHTSKNAVTGSCTEMYDTNNNQIPLFKYGDVWKIPVTTGNEKIQRCLKNRKPIIMTIDEVKNKLDYCNHSHEVLTEFKNRCSKYVNSSEFNYRYEILDRLDNKDIGKKINGKTREKFTKMSEYYNLCDDVEKKEKMNKQDANLAKKLENTCTNGRISNKEDIVEALNIIKEARFDANCCQENGQTNQSALTNTLHYGFNSAFAIANRISLYPNSLQTIYKDKRYNCNNSNFLFRMLKNDNQGCSKNKITIYDLKDDLYDKRQADPKASSSNTIKCGKY